MSRIRLTISPWYWKGGGTISPTTSLGFGLVGGCLAAILVAAVVLVVHGELSGLVPGVLSLIVLKDVAAWFTASPEERLRFRAFVEAGRDNPYLRRTTVPWIAAVPWLVGVVPSLWLLVTRSGQLQLLGLLGLIVCGCLAAFLVFDRFR